MLFPQCISIAVLNSRCTGSSKEIQPTPENWAGRTIASNLLRGIVTRQDRSRLSILDTSALPRSECTLGAHPLDTTIAGAS